MKAGNFGPARSHVDRYIRLRRAAGAGPDERDCLRAKEMMEALERAEKKEKKEMEESIRAALSAEGGAPAGRDRMEKEGGARQRRGSF
mmetsp:Transcript_50314/g.151510  ORF Transcript_50314/g.151510 Transcript_50314/m.151510 type:complete len:88 (-) Transcript_50314:151-414(-)